MINLLNDVQSYMGTGTGCFVDGEPVIVHVHVHVHAVREPGTRGNAIVDIFKLENGKTVEHWDVTQAIPEKTASGNPMF